MYFCGVACNFSLIFKIYLGLFSFFLISLAKCLSIFFIFSKNQELVSLLFSIFAIIYFIYFHLDLHSFFLSFFVMILDFACSCFSSSFDVKLGGLFQFFFFFFSWYKNFPLQTAFVVLHRFWITVSIFICL